MADTTVIHVQIQVFAPPTVMLGIHLVLCRAIATTKPAASCLQVTQSLVIHVLELSNIWRSNTSALEVTHEKREKSRVSQVKICFGSTTDWL